MRLVAQWISSQRSIQQAKKALPDHIAGILLFGRWVCSASLLFDSHELGRGQAVNQESTGRRTKMRKGVENNIDQTGNGTRALYISWAIPVLDLLEPNLISVVAYQIE